MEVGHDARLTGRCTRRAPCAVGGESRARRSALAGERLSVRRKKPWCSSGEGRVATCRLLDQRGVACSALIVTEEVGISTTRRCSRRTVTPAVVPAMCQTAPGATAKVRSSITARYIMRLAHDATGRDGSPAELFRSPFGSARLRIQRTAAPVTLPARHWEWTQPMHCVRRKLP